MSMLLDKDLKLSRKDQEYMKSHMPFEKQSYDLMQLVKGLTDEAIKQHEETDTK